MASSSTSVTQPACNASGWTNYEYPYPCHVNAASFVSIKLLNKDNYVLWSEQMICLLQSHDMLGFINGTLRNPWELHANSRPASENNTSTVEAKYREWKRSDMLVKGWIFGSLGEGPMSVVVGLETANDVWERLKPTYDITPPAPPTITTVKKDLADYLPLYRAIIKNDWEKVQQIFSQQKDKDAIFTAKLDEIGNTALHIAIGKAESIRFVENLLKEINPDSLPTLLNNSRANPLHIAAGIDNTMAAKMLVDKNPCLLFIQDMKSCLPIHITSLNSHRRTFLYLLDACKQHILLSQQHGCSSPFEGKDGALLVTGAITSGFFDASIELIKNYPNMARTTCVFDNVRLIPLLSVAVMGDSFQSGTQYNLYQRFVYAYVPIEKNRQQDTSKIHNIENQETYKAKCLTKSMKTCFYYVIKRIYVRIWEAALLKLQHVKNLQEEKVRHQEALLLVKSICEEVAKINTLNDILVHYEESIAAAVYKDTPEVIEQLIEYFPSATWVNVDGHSILKAAINNRCEKVYNFLLCHLSRDQHFLRQGFDKDNNNLLHLAAQVAPTHKLNRVPGAALQMQRELQWFNEVGNLMKPMYKDRLNNAGETPITVFRREHEKLRKDGEEWMKKTADSYTIVAALIITIVFAAAITVPGGNNGDTGKAIYETKLGFIVFAVSDAISLFSSTTSLLLFLSILTARYQEDDFLYKLPKRLILGLAMLFLSVTSMLVAFSATLYLMSGQGKAWILIPIATLTCLPIASFVTLQLPLLVDLISSTYGRGIFAKQSERKLKQS